MDSVILDKGIAQDLIDDIKEYQGKRDWYK
jgi:hypothetical protein